MVGDKNKTSFNEIKGFLSLQLELRLELEFRLRLTNTICELCALFSSVRYDRLCLCLCGPYQVLYTLEEVPTHAVGNETFRQSN